MWRAWKREKVPGMPQWNKNVMQSFRARRVEYAMTAHAQRNSSINSSDYCFYFSYPLHQQQQQQQDLDTIADNHSKLIAANDRWDAFIATAANWILSLTAANWMPQTKCHVLDTINTKPHTRTATQPQWPSPPSFVFLLYQINIQYYPVACSQSTNPTVDI